MGRKKENPAKEGDSLISAPKGKIAHSGGKGRQLAISRGENPREAGKRRQDSGRNLQDRGKKKKLCLKPARPAKGGERRIPGVKRGANQSTGK